ncbi:MAG TPA: hypothetical protein PK916_16150 [Bacteroidota bacterium]|nr:hypothetical protein [Bacteroidota bacterium]
MKPTFRKALVMIGLLLLLPSWHGIAQLPEQAGAWTLRSSRIGDVDAGDFSAGLDNGVLRALGVVRMVQGTYARERETVVVTLVEMESRERAFALFAFAATPMQRHGIVGDAFAMERNTQHTHYGPFYLHCRGSIRNRAVPDDLVRGIKRRLFTLVDCVSADVPLPLDERVLGSEQYLPPVKEAWALLRQRGLDPVRDVAQQRAAWIARYEKRLAGGSRVLLSFPVRSVQARVALETLFTERYGQGASVQTQCGLPAFDHGNWSAIIARSDDAVLLLLTDSKDSGACVWLRAVAEGAVP